MLIFIQLKILIKQILTSFNYNLIIIAIMFELITEIESSLGSPLDGTYLNLILTEVQPFFTFKRDELKYP